jgi:signal transduction histidine kinase/ligand-binding sensor domain-containing protein
MHIERGKCMINTGNKKRPKEKVSISKHIFLGLLLLVFTIMDAAGSTGTSTREKVRWTSIHHTVKFKKITTRDGLSQSSVLCILQDREGYMWFGTEDGLNKYDGYDFTIYRPEPDNPYSLSSNRIFALYEDHKGTLWIATNGGGLNRFERETGRFYHYRNDDETSFSIGDDNVYTIYEDNSHRLWFGTLGGGLHKLVPADKEGAPPTFIKYKHDPGNPNSIANNNIRAIYQDQEGSLWIGTDGGGLDKLIPGKKANDTPEFVHYGDDLKTPGMSESPAVMAISEDDRFVLWIGTDNGLYSLDRKRAVFTRFPADLNNAYSMSHNYVRRLYKDRAGVIWIGTDGGGLNKLIPGETENTPPHFHCYQYNAYNPDGLSNNAVESLYEDRSGILWIGLYNAGINKLVMRKSTGFKREIEQFIHLRLNPDAPQHSLSHNAVNAICEDHQGNLYVGTDGGGLDKIIPGSTEEEPLRFVNYKFDPDNPGSLSNDNITSLLADHRGEIWIGTYTGGLNKLVPDPGNDTTGRFIHYTHDPRHPGSLSCNFVYSICEAHDGLLWIGTMGGGINRFHWESESFYCYKNNPGNPNSLSIDYVTIVYEDSAKVLWIGTTYGLNKFNKETETFTQYYSDPNKSDRLSSDYISAIYEDKSGTLWFGTEGGGLNQLISPRNQDSPLSFVHYSTAEGLPNNVISNIVEDHQGNLWLTTNNGISKFSPKIREFKNYDVRDGLQSNEFNEGAAWINNYGEIFLGGNNGISIFHPDSLIPNTYIPPIKITDFEIFNKSVPVGKWKEGVTILEKVIDETGEISLPYNYDIFSFQFAALDYINPGKNQYAYKMEDLEKEWNYVGNRRFVTYTTLAPGDYVFRVKGSNNDELWNETGTRIKIRIVPPYWETLWFRVLVISLLVLVIIAAFRIRTHNIKKRARQLEKTNIELHRQIIERNKAELALRESEAKYRKLFASIPNPILIYHRDNQRLLDCNQAALEKYGYTLDQLQTMTMKDLQVVGEAAFTTHITKNGERLQVEVHTAPIDYKGQAAYIAVVRDVTRQMQLEQSLHQVQKMESIGRLAGGIAHDFNNLLTVVIGHADLVLQKMKNNNIYRKYIQSILTAGKRAANLTAQLLAFSRKQIIQPKILEINTIISDLDKMLRRLIGEDIVIEKKFKTDLLLIKADPGQIEQILVNLILNARDAINDHEQNLAKKNLEKKIVMQTDSIFLDEDYCQEHPDAKPGCYVSIVVSDNGIGIDEETKEKIFEPFFTTKEEGKGTGLGMSTVYGIVKQNQGVIHVSSEPGSGTTIKIYWPAIMEKESRELPEKKIQELPRGKETVLFVEDDETVRNFSVSALKEFGYEVFEASNGKKALQLVKEKKIQADLLITDIVMPEMNGEELAEKYKSIYPATRVIYTSGYMNTDIVPTRESDKEVYLLPKPYSSRELLEKIREVLG